MHELERNKRVRVSFRYLANLISVPEDSAWGVAFCCFHLTSERSCSVLPKVVLRFKTAIIYLTLTNNDTKSATLARHQVHEDQHSLVSTFALELPMPSLQRLSALLHVKVSTRLRRFLHNSCLGRSWSPILWAIAAFASEDHGSRSMSRVLREATK